MEIAEVVRITIVIPTTPVTMQTIKIQIIKIIRNRGIIRVVQKGATTTINVAIVINIVKTKIVEIM